MRSMNLKPVFRSGSQNNDIQCVLHTVLKDMVESQQDITILYNTSQVTAWEYFMAYNMNYLQIPALKDRQRRNILAIIWCISRIAGWGSANKLSSFLIWKEATFYKCSTQSFWSDPATKQCGPGSKMNKERHSNFSSVLIHPMPDFQGIFVLM